MKLHNLRVVILFEVRRTLKKVPFWVATLGLPLLFLGVAALGYFSSYTATTTTLSDDVEHTTFTYHDASGVVVPDVATALGGTATDDPVAAAQAVRDGQADLFISIPPDPVTDGVDIVGRDLGPLDSSQWSSLTRALLDQSAKAQIGEPHLTDILDGVPLHTELWSDGQMSEEWGSAIIPVLFLVLLFMSLILLGQQMLNITMEEKENRVSEMILTTTDPTTLIVGKVIGVVLLGIVQGLVLMVPVVIGLLVSGFLISPSTPPAEAEGMLAGMRIVMDPGVIVAAAGLFLAGFLILTGLLVTIGAIMPTAKEAGGAFTAVVIANMAPVYLIGLVVQDPNSVLSVVLTLFPVTAPPMALVRLALGALPLWLGLLSFVITTATAIFALGIGIQLFREGSIAYDKQLSLKRLLPSGKG